MNSNIDFLVVGAGLYGATIAHQLTKEGYNCLIIDKRDHIGGNVYTEKRYGIDFHVYGPHIFHTSNKEVWNFVNLFSEWIPYTHNLIAEDGKYLYHLPFNANTFYDIFGTISPEKAYNIIRKEIYDSGLINKEPQNLEEQAIKLVGKTIYEKLIKHYTEKQWNKSCTEISPSIIKRLPLRYYFDNNYFNDEFQGIPKDGYTKLVYNIIGNIPYLLNWNFKYLEWKDRCKHIIYCGAVDELLDYELGELEWRSLKFETSIYDYNGRNGQGIAVKNLVGPKDECPSTRVIEHMWFNPSIIKNHDFSKGPIISLQTIETPDDWEKGKERYYAINNDDTEKKYNEYCKLLKQKMPEVILGGRLGKYRYFDMDDTILEAMNDAKKILERYDTRRTT